MPELPEVETVKRGLKKRILNRVIKKALVYYEGIIEEPGVFVFCEKIKNQRINDIERYGKWLIFVLDDYYLLSHLRMEGKYFIRDSNSELVRNEHIVFRLDDDTDLRYMDVRKFGKIHLIEKRDIDKVGPLIKLGLEPWDSKLSVGYLKEKYSKKRLPIKSVLLDQEIVVGVGNIYADEILFLSKINPYKRAMELREDELEAIIESTRKVLEKAIASGGTTIRNYSSVDGVEGLFQHELLVHSREGEKCFVCNNNIVKVRIGGRGTYYCRECQK